MQLLLTPAELKRIGREGGPAGRYLATKARLWMNLWRLCFGTPGAVIFDCFAVLALTHPQLLGREHRFAAVARDAHARRADNPRDIHLIAAFTPGNDYTREVVFCRDPLFGAREVLIERLLARP
ncbi:MAG: hypothetical protein JO117_04160 [Verrucomicrobia bacterium]|nr:hypothetical protein [Verrucomicrobiota bacterium]